MTLRMRLRGGVGSFLRRKNRSASGLALNGTKANGPEVASRADGSRSGSSRVRRRSRSTAVHVIKYFLLFSSAVGSFAFLGWIGFVLGISIAQLSETEIIEIVAPKFSTPLPVRRSLMMDSKRYLRVSLAEGEDRKLFSPFTDAPHQQKNVSSPDIIHGRVAALISEYAATGLRAVGGIPIVKSRSSGKWIFDNTAAQNHTFKPLEDTPSDHPRIEHSWYKPNALDLVNEYNSSLCEPMHEWQLDSRPNCNAFHELDLPTVKLISVGGARVAFGMSDTFEAKFVYKTIKYSRKFSSDHVEEQRRDSLVMERASGSRFIPDIHGYCGFGVKMDFMPEGNMNDYIKGSRLAGGSKLPPVDKLRIAIHIATAVADMHTMTSFFHNDICCHQFLFHDGIFKLNDFNMAGPFYINNRTGSKDHCTRDKYEDEAYTWKGRSLEEFQRLLKLTNYTAPDPEKVDIWMMGNLIFTILTDEYTFEKPRLDMRKAAAKLVVGERTPYPERIRNSTEPSYMAMKTALDMSWTHRWQERPSARSVASYLHEQLREITGENDPDLRVTLPERDPKQKGTESDFNRVNCVTQAGRIKKKC